MPSAADQSSERQGSALFLGDVVLAGEAGRRIDRDGAGSVFAHCPTGFFDADVVCFNLECCLTEAGESIEPKPVTLVGRDRFLKAMPHPERCVASVANNHFLDRGVVGADDTIRALNDAGIACIGAVVDGDVGQPQIRQTPGGSIGLLAFSACAHRLDDDARVNLVRHDAAMMCDAVAMLRNQVDVVVIMLHHGVEFCPYPHPGDRRLCRRLAEAGADLIVAHHPHVVQGIEAFGDSLVFHSVGNFLFDPLDAYRPENGWTLAVRASVVDGSLAKVDVEPFILRQLSLPEPMMADELDALQEHLHALSCDLHDPRRARKRTRIAQRARFKERVGSAFNMVRRVGVTRTAQYYWGRISNG